MTRIHITSIALALLLASAVFAAEDKAAPVAAPKIRAAVKPAQATIGDVLEYRINISGKDLGKVAILLPERKVAFPEKAADAKAADKGEPAPEDPADSVPLYIIHGAKKFDDSDKNITDITVIMNVSFYRPGKHELPEVEIQGTDRVKIGYKIPEVTIKSLNEKGEFQDIEPPLELSGNYTRLILLLAAAALLGVAGVFAYRKVRQVLKERAAQVPVIPAIDLFLEEIGRLDPRGLIERGRIDEYVFGMSMVFRRFLSRKFRFDAVDLTSDEIIIRLKKLLPREQYDKYHGDIGRCFNLWDLSKFAEFAPSQELLLQNLSLTGKIAETIAKDSVNGTDRV